MTVAGAVVEEREAVARGSVLAFQGWWDTAPPSQCPFPWLSDTPGLVWSRGLDESVRVMQAAEERGAHDLGRFGQPMPETGAGEDAPSITLQGQPVGGLAKVLGPSLLRWERDNGLLVGGTYTPAALHLQDLAGTAIAAPSVTLTHLAGSPEIAYVAWRAAGDSAPRAASAYGLTTLFQGRTWHADLGLYHYRARWYLPEAGVFGERDPVGFTAWSNLFQAFGVDSANGGDPFGLQDQKARNVHGIPIPEIWYRVTPARVAVDGRTYLVSPSGTVMDEEAGRVLPDTDERARRAREATGWSFSDPGLSRSWRRELVCSRTGGRWASSPMPFTGSASACITA